MWIWVAIYGPASAVWMFVVSVVTCASEGLLRVRELATVSGGFGLIGGVRRGVEARSGLLVVAPSLRWSATRVRLGMAHSGRLGSLALTRGSSS